MDVAGKRRITVAVAGCIHAFVAVECATIAKISVNMV